MEQKKTEKTLRICRKQIELNTTFYYPHIRFFIKSFFILVLVLKIQVILINESTGEGNFQPPPTNMANNEFWKTGELDDITNTTKI